MDDTESTYLIGSSSSRYDSDDDDSITSDGADRISLWKKLSFGIGAAPNQLTHTFIGFFLNPFLLDYARLQPRVVGGIVLMGRAFDALMDPLVGYMTTRTRLQSGSYKPWIAGGLLPVVIGFFLIWGVPPWYSDSGKAAFVVVSYLLYTIAIGMYYVPYTALTMHVSNRSEEIDIATMYRMVSETLSVFVAAALAKAISPMFNHFEARCETSASMWCSFAPEQLAFMAEAAIISGICVAAGIILLTGVSEQTSAVYGTQPSEPFISGFLKVATTHSYRVLIVMFLWVWMAVAMVQANFILYCNIVLKLSLARASNLLLTLLGATVCSMPVWFVLMIRLGKRATFTLALSLEFFLFLSLYFVHVNASHGMQHVQFACIGFPLGAVYLVPAAMLPDVINEAALRDRGCRREALFYSYFVFIQKLGGGLAIYISNQILESVGGYNSNNTTEENEVAAGTLRTLTGVVPACLVLLSIALSTQYPHNAADERRIKMCLEELRSPTGY
eukprot:m.246018 g.246018  ORF g.246018 m.246018 type:complete len:502 (+) comp19484_c0_seq1:471-1976(+)